MAPARQVREVARQCAEWTAPGSDFYAGLVRRVGDGGTGALASDLDRGRAGRPGRHRRAGRVPARDLLPLAPEQDAAGREVYGRASRAFLGATVDLDEAYLWGWDEVLRIEAEMDRVAGQITGGGTVDDAVAVLDADPARIVHGRDRARAWMQGVADQVIENLDGTALRHPAARPADRGDDRADRGRRHLLHEPERGLDPAGPDVVVAAGRRGRVQPPGGRSPRSITRACPGITCRPPRCCTCLRELNRWQRMICWVSGHGEGWALYAERLMDELGYLSDPGDLMGLLDSQLLRAVRVVVDLGVHLSLRIPGDSRGGRARPGTPGGLGVPPGPVPDQRRHAALRTQPLPGLAGAGAVVQAR